MAEYFLKTTNYNPTANVWFDTAPENAALESDRMFMAVSLHNKNEVDAIHGVNTTYGQEPDGTYTKTHVIRGFSSVDAAETYVQDQLNSSFWQQNIFPWQRDNGVKSRTEITDASGNLVQLLHDNRSISVQGDGPSAWALYTPN